MYLDVKSRYIQKIYKIIYTRKIRKINSEWNAILLFRLNYKSQPKKIRYNPEQGFLLGDLLSSSPRAIHHPSSRRRRKSIDGASAWPTGRERKCPSKLLRFASFLLFPVKNPYETRQMVGRDFATFFCRGDKRLLRGRRGEREREKKIDKNESPFLDPRHLQPRRNIGKNIQMLAPSIRDYHHDTAIDFQRPLERPIGDESPINVA